MNIDLLSKMVKELILENDKVVLPGLGCFVAELEPASFSDKGFTINPPYRKMFFRTKPDEGNELIKFYADNNQIEESLAEQIIIDFLTELKSVLQTKKLVVFPGLGRLRATKENNFFFVADQDLDIYEAGFALEPISLKSHEETKEEISARVTDIASILPSETNEEQKDSKQETVEEIDKEEKKSVKKKTESKPGVKALIIIAIVVIIIVIALVVFALLAREYPEVFDQYLYTKEELEILNTII